MEQKMNDLMVKLDNLNKVLEPMSATIRALNEKLVAYHQENICPNCRKLKSRACKKLACTVKK